MYNLRLRENMVLFPSSANAVALRIFSGVFARLLKVENRKSFKCTVAFYGTATSHTKYANADKLDFLAN